MSIYGVSLFVHVVFAIALVGGSVAMHVVSRFAVRTEHLDRLRGHLTFMAWFSKQSLVFAMVTLAAGLHLAFAGDWWGTGWPVVSLVLFAAAGAMAGGYLDPRVAEMQAAVEEAGGGVVTPAVAAAVGHHGFHRVVWIMAGLDLAIVYLMTNKPSWTGSIVAAVVGVAFGALMAQLEARRDGTGPGHAPAA